METPETLNCLVNNVGPATVVIPAKVERPETLILVEFKLSIVEFVLLKVAIVPIPL